MGIHPPVNACVFKMRLIGRLGWRPPETNKEPPTTHRAAWLLPASAADLTLVGISSAAYMYAKLQALEQVDLPSAASAVLQKPGFSRLHTQHATPVSSSPVPIVGRRPMESTATAPMTVAGSSPAAQAAHSRSQ